MAIELELKPRLGTDDSKLRADVEALNNKYELKLKMGIDSASQSAVNNAVKNMNSKIKSTSGGGLQVFDVQKLEKQGRQYLAQANNIVARSKKMFQTNDNAVDVTNIAKNAEGKIKSYTVAVTKANGEIEKFNFNRAKLKNGQRKMTGFVMDGSKVFDKSAEQGVLREQQALEKLNKAKIQASKLEYEIYKSDKTSGYLSKDNSTTKAYEEYNRYIKALDSGLPVTTKAAREMDNLGAKVRLSIQKAKEANKDITTPGVLTSSETARYESRVNALKSRWNLLSMGKFSDDSKKGVNDAITALDDTFNKVKAGTASVKDFNMQFSAANQEIRKFSSFAGGQTKVQAWETKLDAWKQRNSAAFGVGGVANESYFALRNRLSELNNTTDPEKLKNGLNEISESFRNLNEQTIKAGQNQISFKDRMAISGDRLKAYLASMLQYRLVYQTFGEMWNSAKDVNTAWTGFKMISDMTPEGYERYFEGIKESAKETGQELSNMIGIVTEFKRLGLTEQQALSAGKTAAVLGNVAWVDKDSATEYITSTMKAYDIAPDKTMRIADALSVADSEFAVSASGVGEALKRSSASLSVANNTMEENIAMITAMDEILQNSETTGTILKTVALKIRQTDGLRGDMLRLTGGAVDIMKDEDTFNSTFKIIDDLASVWSELTDASRAKIISSVGGVRAGQGLSAMLTNWGSAKRYMALSENMDGDALAKNEKAMSSIEKKLTVFKSTFQDVSSSIVNSSFVNFLISGLTKVADLISTISDGIGGFAGLGVMATPLLSMLGIKTGMFSSSVDAFGNRNAKFFGADIISGNSNIGSFVKEFNRLPAENRKTRADWLAEQRSPYAGYADKLVKNGKDASVGGYVGFSIGQGTKNFAKSIGVGALNMLVSGLIGAGISIIGGQIEKAATRKQNARDRLISEGEKKEQSAKNISDAVQDYDNLRTAMLSGTITAKDFADGRKTVEAALEAEGLKVDELIRQYGDLDTAMNAVKADKLGDAITSKISAREAEKKNAVDKIGDAFSILDLSDRRISLGTSEGAEKQAKALAKVMGTSTSSDTYSKATGGAVTESFVNLPHQVGTFGSDKFSDYWENYKALQKALKYAEEKYGAESDAYQAINEQYTVYAGAMESVVKASKEVNQLIADRLVTKNTRDISNQADFDAYVDDLTKRLEAESGFEKKAGSARDFVLAELESRDEYKQYIANTKADSQNTYKKKILNGRRTKSYRDIKKWLDVQSSEDLRIAYELSLTEDSSVAWTVNDWEYQMKSVKDSAKALDELHAKAQALQDVDSGTVSFDIDKEMEDMKTFIDQKKESASGSGLTAENLGLLKGRYSFLEQYDEEELFDRTANGIQLNTTELRKLENAYESYNKTYFDSALDEQVEKYNNLTDAINKESDAVEKAKLISEQQNLLGQIESVSELAAQYEGVTSAYKAWIDAQDGADVGDNYDTFTGKLEDIKAMYDKGEIGLEKFRTAVQLMSNEDLSEASAEDIMHTYERAVPNINKYFTEGQEGARAFVSALSGVNDSWVEVLDNGNYKIDIGTDEMEKAAEGLGISEEAIELVLDKLRAYGWDININSPYGDIELNESEIEKSVAKLKEVGALSSDKTFNFNTETVEQVSSEIVEANKVLDKFKNDSGDVDINIEGASDALKILQVLTVQKQKLSEPAVMKVDTSKLEGDAKQQIADIQSFIQANNNFEIAKVTYGADLSAAQDAVDKAFAKIKELPQEVITTLKIDTSSASAALESLKKIDPETLVTFGIDPSLVEGYTPPQVETEVKYNKDSTVVDNYNSQFPKYLDTWVVYHKVGDGTGAPGLNISPTTDGKGKAKVYGSAYADGSWGVSGNGVALVGELGPEICVRDGQYYLLGEQGAELFHYKNNDIIFNAAQTKELLSQGKIVNSKRRGEAYEGGKNNGGTGGFFLGGKRVNASSPASGTGNSSGGQSGSDDDFEKKYNRLKHLRAMDIIDEKRYYRDLKALNEEYYGGREDKQEEYWKYEEELYELSKSIYNNEISFLKHQAEMIKNSNGSLEEQLALYEQIEDKSHKIAEEARARGIGEDNEIITEAQSDWWDARNARNSLIEDDVNERIDFWNHQVDMMEHTDETEGERKAVLTSIMQEAHRAAEDARARGYSEDSEFIQNLQKTYYDALGQIDDVNEALLERSETYFQNRNYFNDWEASGDSETEALRRVRARFEENGYTNEDRKKFQEFGSDMVDDRIEQLEKYMDRESSLGRLSLKDRQQIYGQERQIIEQYYAEGAIDAKKYHELIDDLNEKSFSNIKDHMSDIISDIESYTSVAVAKLQALADSYDWIIEREQALTDGLQSQYDVQNKLADSQKSLNKELAASKKLKEYLNPETYKLLFNQEDYDKLSGVLETLNGEVEDTYTWYSNQLSKLTEDNWYLEESITKEYERRLNMKEKEYEIAKLELNLNKKRLELENVLAEKNVRVFSGGQWVAVANMKDVQNATEAVSEAEDDLAEAERKRTQQETIDSMQRHVDSLQRIQDSYNNQIEMINKATDELRLAYDEYNKPVKSLGQLVAELNQSGVGAFSDALNNVTSALNRASTRIEFNDGAGSSASLPSYARKDSYLYSADASGGSSGGGSQNLRNYYQSIADNKNAPEPERVLAKKMLERFADGTDNYPGGWSITQEEGPEALMSKKGGMFTFMPSGSKVFSNAMTERLWNLVKNKDLYERVIGGVSVPKFGMDNSDNRKTSYFEGAKIEVHPADFNAFVRELNQKAKSVVSMT